MAIKHANGPGRSKDERGGLEGCRAGTWGPLGLDSCWPLRGFPSVGTPANLCRSRNAESQALGQLVETF